MRFLALGCGLAFSWTTAALVAQPAQREAQQPSGAVATTGQSPSFDAASIKPSKPGAAGRHWDHDANRLQIQNYTLKDLITSAYDLKSPSQVLAGPDWLDKLHFDVSAVADDTEMARIKALSDENRHNEWLAMLQSLLADRFGLKVSRSQQTVPIYALVVSKSGSKLKAADPNDQNNGSFDVHNTHMEATGVGLDSLAEHLSRNSECGRVVLNRTGLDGRYTFTMDWTLESAMSPDAQFPDLFTALREQLGLELKPDKGLVDVVTVESATQPTAD